MGFVENPFNKSSAEEEIKYINKIYKKPNYYSSLLSEIEDGNSRIVFGERGIGKSAMMLNLQNDLKNKDLLVIVIDDYDDIPLKTNDFDLLLVVVEKIVQTLSIELLKNPIKVKKLNKIEKEKLSLFISLFFNKMSSLEFEELYNTVQRHKIKNLFKQLYNKVLCKIVNTTVSGGIEVVSDLINKSLNLPAVNNVVSYKSYLPEMRIEKIGDVDKRKYKYKELKLILEELIVIVKKLGFKNTAVLLDKIDEFKKINGDVSKIVEFVKDFMLDTKLLYIDGASFVFFLWSRISSDLNQQSIRYDKFRTKDIIWSENDLIDIIDNRLLFFSNRKLKSNDIFESSEDLQLVFKCANRSPRDVIILLSKIYDEQEILNNSSIKFSTESVFKGINSFINSYDFHSIYPKQKGAQIDIMGLIAKLEKVAKSEFLVSDLASVTKVGPQAASSHIKLMLKYGLVAEIPNPEDGRIKKYLINDPVVKMIIEGIS